MYLLNPLRPGSVTTDIIADDAVTCVKTAFGSCTLNLHQVTFDNVVPSLVSPYDILITASWPNQSLSLNPYMVLNADGASIDLNGTGTTEKGTYLNFKAAGVGWYSFHTDYQDNNTQNFMFTDNLNSVTIFTYDHTNGFRFATPLGISSGGTGTATPALVAGANISITGTFPNQTVSLVDNPIIQSPTIIGNIIFGNSTYKLGIEDDTGETPAKYSITSVGAARIIEIDVQSPYNVIFPQADVEFDHNIQLLGRLTEYNSVALAGVGIPSIVAEVDLTGQTSTILPTPLFTPAGAGMYRVSVHAFLHNASGTSISIQPFNDYSLHGGVLTLTTGILSSSASGDSATDGVFTFYTDGTAPIHYQCNSSLGAGDYYDLHIRLERI